MTKLSPVTQTIMNAWIENTNYAPIDNEPFALAAALRAAADQVVPEEPYCHEDDLMSEYIRRSQRQETRAKLFAIAAELEGQ